MATSRTTTSHRWFLAVFVFISLYEVHCASIDDRQGARDINKPGKHGVEFSKRGNEVLKRVQRNPVVMEAGKADVDPADKQRVILPNVNPHDAQGDRLQYQNNPNKVPLRDQNKESVNIAKAVPYHVSGEKKRLAQNQAPQAQPQGPGQTHKSTAIKIADNPDCSTDVKRLCSEKAADNNFAILDCLQHDFKTETDVNKKCQNFIWHYKKNLTLDIRFDSATTEVCNKDLEQITECSKLEKGKGHVIPCLVDNKEKVIDDSCKMFLKKMASIVFADYRLIYRFAEKCAKEVHELVCGRLPADGEDAAHSQGKTLECLSSNTDKLTPECKHEILRVAELQSDDYHMDRTLFYACREAREAFCDKVPSGGGKVFKCLYKHKFDKGMTPDCQKQLVRRQKLMSDDYKVNRGFANKCDADIKKHKCLDTAVPEYDKGRLAHVLLCLESATRDGEDLEAGCLQEMTDMRKSLMSDYQISPEIVKGCAEEIHTHCGKLHRNGKTLHCLMKLAKPSWEKDPNGDAHDFPGHLQQPCLTALEDLIEEADPGEDYHVDPTLQEACASVVDIACKDVKAGDGKVLGCLMEHVGTDRMNSECEERLLELQFFLSREFKS